MRAVRVEERYTDEYGATRYRYATRLAWESRDERASAILGFIIIVTLMVIAMGIFRGAQWISGPGLKYIVLSSPVLFLLWWQRTYVFYFGFLGYLVRGAILWSILWWGDWALYASVIKPMMPWGIDRIGVWLALYFGSMYVGWKLIFHVSRDRYDESWQRYDMRVGQ